MSSTTERRSFRNDPLHGGRIALYVAFVAVVAAACESPLFAGSLPWVRKLADVLLTPSYVVAGGFKVQEAINLWKGIVEERTFRLEFGYLLLYLILYFVVAPTLVVKGHMARARWHEQAGAKGPSWKIGLALVAGWSLILVTIPSALTGGYSSLRSYRHMELHHDVAANRDALIDAAALMARQAQVRYVLPHSAGGSGGSWLNKGDTSKPAISLVDLTRLDPGTSKIMGIPPGTASGSFQIEIPARDSLVIWGIGAESNDENSSFANRDGEKGKVQIHAGVTPRSIRMMEDN